MAIACIGFSLLGATLSAETIIPINTSQQFKVPKFIVHRIALTDFIPRVLQPAHETPIEEPRHEQVSRGQSSTHEMTVEVTAYNWTGYKCANLKWPIDGETIAMNDLPFGTHVYITGIGDRIVEDRPDTHTQLDVYMGHRTKDAIKFGRRKLKVIVRD